MFSKVLILGHCQHTICCNGDQHIMAMKQMSNEWHSFKTIFANTLLNCTNSQDDPNSSKNVVLFSFKKLNCITGWGVCDRYCGILTVWDIPISVHGASYFLKNRTNWHWYVKWWKVLHSQTWKKSEMHSDWSIRTAKYIQNCHSVTFKLIQTSILDD